MARLHVHEYGDPDGEPVICLHGLGGHGARYRRMAAFLPHRRVVAPDLRGHGRSTFDPPWTTGQHVADVLETVDGAGADWIGFSFGGRILATIAAIAPERVRRMVLLDPALTLPVDVAAQRAEDARATTTYADAAEALEQAVADPNLFSTPRELLEEEVVTYAARPDGLLEPRVCRPMEVTSWSEMARVPPPVSGHPVLVVTGARSWIPVDVARLVPDEHVEVPGGHSVLWDDLPRTGEAVARFLP
jgi:lipase